MFKTVWKRLHGMGDVARSILRGGLLVTCTALLCTLGLTLAAELPGRDTYYLLACAAALREMAPGLLLIAVIGSAVAETVAAGKER